MPLVTSKEMLQTAYSKGYAVCAFAVHNLEIMKAVISAAEQCESPVILQTTPGTIRYLGMNYIVQTVKTLADASEIPVALHLDHGDSFETVMACIRGGYTSIMIDGSHLDFEENILLVKKVVEACKPLDIPVEAELGSILRNDGEGALDASAYFTDPDLADEFVQRTEVDFLAPAFGTIHGVYQRKPNLDFERLKKIADKTGIPLVMHGASGLEEEEMRNSLKYGISKVNFSTELKIGFAEELRGYLLANDKESDPRKYFLSARETVKEIASRKISLLREKRKEEAS
ncbi:class II fructose-bisphosphate aldolase [Metabacillus sp. RGM 3146]|uniref:class II fructose-bisphosphate aldolase n=1 Tax=Metabacillus sp. RGM 3146 TaxID=3401092 RepID=UPI003B9CBF9A